MVPSSSKKVTFISTKELTTGRKNLGDVLIRFASVKSSYGGSAMKNSKEEGTGLPRCCSAMFLVSCEKEKISDINADPGRFHGKEIQIAGKVTQSIGALGKGVYQLNDGTGSLWVIPTNWCSQQRYTVGVKGTVLPSFTFSRRELRHRASRNRQAQRQRQLSRACRPATSHGIFQND
jgi:hypothetical protein